MPVEPENDDPYSVNVTGLRPYSAYKLRMRAENELGTSNPSIPSDEFKTLEVKPDLYPQEVGGGGGKVGELVITWRPLDAWQWNGPGIGYEVRWRETGDDDDGWAVRT